MKPVLLLILLAAACSPAAEQATQPALVVIPPPSDTSAHAAALAWLAVIDAGRYESSWEHASVAARSVFPRDQWSNSIRAVRSRLGTLQARELAAIRDVADMPGAPGGRYVLVEYRTQFANDPAAVEQVILISEDGVWRGFGYSVRNVPR